MKRTMLLKKKHKGRDHWEVKRVWIGFIWFRIKEPGAGFREHGNELSSSMEGVELTG
jgi:hypothetical protein